MPDYLQCTWYVQEPRTVRAMVYDKPDAEADEIMCVAEDANTAAAIVNDHNAALKKTTKKG